MRPHGLVLLCLACLVPTLSAGRKPETTAEAVSEGSYEGSPELKNEGTPEGLSEDEAQPQSEREEEIVETAPSLSEPPPTLDSSNAPDSLPTSESVEDQPPVTDTEESDSATAIEGVDSTQQTGHTDDDSAHEGDEVDDLNQRLQRALHLRSLTEEQEAEEIARMNTYLRKLKIEVKPRRTKKLRKLESDEEDPENSAEKIGEENADEELEDESVYADFDVPPNERPERYQWPPVYEIKPVLKHLMQFEPLLDILADVSEDDLVWSSAEKNAAGELWLMRIEMEELAGTSEQPVLTRAELKGLTARKRVEKNMEAVGDLLRTEISASVAGDNPAVNVVELEALINNMEVYTYGLNVIPSLADLPFGELTADALTKVDAILQRVGVETKEEKDAFFHLYLPAVVEIQEADLDELDIRVTQFLKTLSLATDSLQATFREKITPTSPDPVAFSDEMAPEYKATVDTAHDIIRTRGIRDHESAYRLFEAAAAAGHQESGVKTATAKLFGSHLPHDVPYAFEYFEQLAANGDPAAQMMLAVCHSLGLGTPESVPRSIVYATFAALGGNPHAQLMLGYRFWAGNGVEKSCETALQHYSKVATYVIGQVSPITGGAAVQRIHIWEEGEQAGSQQSQMLDDDLIQYYQFLADKGDTSAQLGLGQLFLQGGRGVEMDAVRALFYFESAAAQQNAMALAYLGKMYLEGAGVAQNNDTAFGFFQKAADKGNPIGASGLGLIYMHGYGVASDYSKALTYFQTAAEQGWAEAQFNLGLMYHLANGVPHNPKQAMKYFHLASQGGNIEAIYQLAQIHAQGLGVARSCQVAVDLFKAVSERGPWAKEIMEAFYFYKNDRPLTALLMYLYLGEHGYEVAQGNAAHLLEQYSFTLFNSTADRRALLNWQRAANQGSVYGKLKMGDFYYYGRGTEADLVEAARHYKQAGEQHNAQAYFNLAYMHEHGLGMTTDIHLAKRYYDMAAGESSEAALPVSLALSKLSARQFFSTLALPDWSSFSNLFDSSLFDIPNMESIVNSVDPRLRFGPQWQTYVLTVFCLVIGIVFGLRMLQREGL